MRVSKTVATRRRDALDRLRIAVEAIAISLDPAVRTQFTTYAQSLMDNERLTTDTIIMLTEILRILKGFI